MENPKNCSNCLHFEEDGILVQNGLMCSVKPSTAEIYISKLDQSSIFRKIMADLAQLSDLYQAPGNSILIEILEGCVYRNYKLLLRIIELHHKSSQQFDCPDYTAGIFEDDV